MDVLCSLNSLKTQRDYHLIFSFLQLFPSMNPNQTWFPIAPVFASIRQ